MPDARCLVATVVCYMPGVHCLQGVRCLTVTGVHRMTATGLHRMTVNGMRRMTITIVRCMQVERFLAVAGVGCGARCMRVLGFVACRCRVCHASRCGRPALHPRFRLPRYAGRQEPITAQPARPALHSNAPSAAAGLRRSVIAANASAPRPRRCANGHHKHKLWYCCDGVADLSGNRGDDVRQHPCLQHYCGDERGVGVSNPIFQREPLGMERR